MRKHHRTSDLVARRATIVLAGAAFLVAGPAGAQQGVRGGGPSSGPRLEFPAGRDWVELPFQLEQGKVVVPLRVNGSEPLDVVFDTGASGAVLTDPDAAARIDFDFAGRVRVAGAGVGRAPTVARRARNVRFDLGELTLSGAKMAVVDGGGSLDPLPWQGVVGREILDQLVVEIDWSRRLLRFAEPLRFRPPAGSRVVPLARERGHVFVRGEVVLADGPAQPVQLVVDSGASHALALDPRRFEGLPEPRLDGVRLGRGLSGEIRGSVARIRELRLGGFTFSDVLTRFPEPAAADVVTSHRDGNLGTEVLRRLVVTFDYSRRQMLLRPTEALDEPFPFATAGLAVFPALTDAGTARVDDVYPGSPAARAGLREGDELVRLDGRSPAELGLDAVRALLEQPPGTRLKLDLRRAGKTFSTELKLERLL